MAFKTFVNGINLPASEINDYLMKQSVMTFASSAARASALTAPVEGMLTYLADVNRYEFFNGSSWQMTDGIYADLATRTSTISSPFEGMQSFLRATSAVDTANQIDFYNGSAWESIYTPGRNAVINGAMEICQRGTGSSVAGATSSTNGFLVDRWQCYRAAFAAGSTMFQQTTSSLPGFINALQYRRTSGDTSTATMYMSQTFETRTSIPLAGQLVTLSFYARIGANFSGSNLVASVITGTGTDQNVTGGFTGSATAASLSIPVASLSTTWQRFSVTGLVASAAKQIAVQFSYNPTGTAGTEDTFDITGVQLEAGSVASPFRRAGGTWQGELAACQRYYYRVNAATTATQFGIGRTTSTADSQTRIQLPVSMRTVPSTTLDWTGTIANYSIIEGTSGRTTSGTPAVSVNSTPEAAVINMGISGATGGLFAVLTATSTAAYLGFSAEL